MTDDHGRVSLFLAAALAGVLIIIGLAYDGAGRLRTMQRAQNLAAEAARTGGQSIDLAAAIAGETPSIDEGQAQTAVGNYLAAVPDVGEWQATVAADGQTITVRVDIAYDTAMLDLFGFDDTIPVRGLATAQLRTEE
jgi:hypothetical protein